MQRDLRKWLSGSKHGRDTFAFSEIDASNTTSDNQLRQANRCVQIVSKGMARIVFFLCSKHEFQQCEHVPCFDGTREMEHFVSARAEDVRDPEYELQSCQAWGGSSLDCFWTRQECLARKKVYRRCSMNATVLPCQKHNRKAQMYMYSILDLKIYTMSN